DNMQALCVLKSTDDRRPVQLEQDLGVVLGGVLGPHLKVVKRRIAAKAHVGPGQIALKVRLCEFALIGELGVNARPLTLADLPRKILDCGLRRSRRAQETCGSSIRQRCGGLVGAENADGNQQSRGDNDEDGEPTSAFHMASLPGSNSSAGTGASTCSSR